MLALLLFLAVNARLTSAQCDCGDNSRVIEFFGHTETFFPPTDNVTGAPCLVATTCSYNVTLIGQALLDPAWGGLTITTWGFNPGTCNGQLFYYDGVDNTVYNSSLNNVTESYVTAPTANSSARVYLSQTNCSNSTATSFVLGFQPAKATPTSPKPPTTTTGSPPPTSPPYFTCNATQLQFELAVVVDCSNLANKSDFEQMVIFAGTTLPQSMTIITDNRSKNSTRITLARAAPYTSTTASTIGNIFPPWSQNFDGFSGQVNLSVRQISTSNNNSAFANTLEQLKLLAYNNPTYYPIRPHAMKLVVIITGADVDSDEADSAGGRLTQIFNDLHGDNILTLAITVGPQNSTLLDYGPWQERVYMNRNDLNSNESFIELMNNLLCDGNKMCRQDDCGQTYNLTSAGIDAKTIQTNNFNKTNETLPSRYCNNMDCGYTFYNGDGNTSRIEIEVGNYDLETGYDFLRVFDLDTNVTRATFTGNSVSNSKVCVGGSAALVHLFTNVEQVYGGFVFTARLVPAGSCPIPDKAHVEVNGRVASD